MIAVLALLVGLAVGLGFGCLLGWTVALHDLETDDDGGDVVELHEWRRP